MKAIHDYIKVIKALFHSLSTSLSFAQIGDMRLHVKAIHDGVKAKCTICGKEFNRAPEMRRHQKSVHKTIAPQSEPHLDSLHSSPPPSPAAPPPPPVSMNIPPTSHSPTALYQHPVVGSHQQQQKLEQLLDLNESFTSSNHQQSPLLAQQPSSVLGSVLQRQTSSLQQQTSSLQHPGAGPSLSTQHSHGSSSIHMDLVAVAAFDALSLPFPKIHPHR